MIVLTIASMALAAAAIALVAYALVVNHRANQDEQRRLRIARYYRAAATAIEPDDGYVRPVMLTSAPVGPPVVRWGAHELAGYNQSPDGSVVAYCSCGKAGPAALPVEGGEPYKVAAAKLDAEHIAPATHEWLGRPAP